MSIVISNTPWDWYKVDNTVIHVKREDMCCPEPGPSFSKIRGVEMHLRQLVKERKRNVPIGVLDTVHSKAGWGVSYVCDQMSLQCYDFFPAYKHEIDDDGFVELRENQRHAEALGAHLIPLGAGRSSILYHEAKKLLAEGTGGMGYMLPNALKLSESVDATCLELIRYTPGSLLKGTWIVSASSGTLAAGVLKGLYGLDVLDKVCLVIHLGYSRPKHAVLDYVRKMARLGDTHADIVIVDEGYEYKDSVEADCPFPCNEYYDLKAWRWLQTHAGNLEEPVVFWNIGL